MTILQAILMGIIQGVTEFLPISSSGHLVLTPNLFGWEISSQEAFAFDIFLQAATLIAVISYFFNDLWRVVKETISAIQELSFESVDSKLGFYLIISTIPASIVGLSFNGFFEGLFSNPLITSFLLMLNAIILISAEKFGKNERRFNQLTWFDSLWVGFFQIMALLPGISRSGITITAGMFRNFERQSAAKYSFLISIPLLIGAGLNGFHRFLALPNTTMLFPMFVIGSIISAIVGYLSIKWLIRFLEGRSLIYFAVYCFVFGILNLIIIVI